MIVFGLLHIAISALLAYGLSSIFGQLNAWISILSLGGSLILSAYLLDYTSIDFVNLRFGAWRRSTTGILEKVVFALIIFVGLRHFIFLFYQVDNEVRSLHQFNLGDLPLHVHYIRNLASGVDFPPVNPNFSTELLRYPYGIDLYDALWETLGVPMGSHLFLVGIFCTCASLVCLRLAGSWLAMIAIFFSGGFIAIERGGPQAVQNLLAWKNLFLSMFITQRGFIWALPVGVLLVYFLVLNARRKPDAPIHPRTLLITGILWASLAFFHLHTFFILSLMILIMQIYRSTLNAGDALPLMSRVKEYFFVWVWPAAIGTYFVLFSLNLFKSSGLMHWHFGWTFEPGQNFLYYLSANLGPYLLLFFGVGFYIAKFRLKNLYFEYTVGVALFLLFFNLMLAPWAWDNIKILVWPYLALTFLSYEVLRKHWTLWTQVVLLISLSYGGIYALSASQFSTEGHIVLYAVGDLANMRAATQDIAPNKVFASGTTYDHELTALGRKRAMGYEGHLWAHGISFLETKKKLSNLMAGGDHWLEDANALKVSYILWGPKERTEFQVGGSDPIWRSQLKNISRVKDYEVFELPKNEP